MTLILTILGILILWYFIKPYFIRHDTVALYTGGLGSGKTLVGVSDSLRLLKRNRLKVWWYNLWHKVKKEKPMLYSSIPIKINKNEMSINLTNEHLLMCSRVNEKSVVFIDEVGLFLNSFVTVLSNKNVRTVEDFCTLFRHYTKGGFLILTTQSTAKCNYVIRYCCNEAYVLSDFNTIPILKTVYWHKVRHITLTDDIKTIEEGQMEDNFSWRIGFFGRRKYDTYAFSDRYNTVPSNPETYPDTLKRLDFIKLPDNYVEPKCYVQKNEKQTIQSKWTCKHTNSK